jgi:hypothetical protein
MILKVAISDTEWQFIPLKGPVTIDFNGGEWPPQPIDLGGTEPTYPVSHTICGFDSFLLDEQMKNGRNIFPVVRDAEQSIIFNRVAYLLNDNGNTIEKIQA